MGLRVAIGEVNTMAEYVCDFVNQRDGAYPHDELPGPTEIFNERRERVIRCRDCKHQGDVKSCPLASLLYHEPSYAPSRSIDGGFCAWAEPLSRFLSKGAKVAIDGKLRYSSWEAKDGTKRSKLEVVVDEVEFLSARQQQGAQHPYKVAAPAQQTVTNTPQADAYDDDNCDDDDDTDTWTLPDYLRQEGVSESEALYRLIKECDKYDRHGRRL